MSHERAIKKHEQVVGTNQTLHVNERRLKIAAGREGLAQVSQVLRVVELSRTSVDQPAGQSRRNDLA